MKKTILVAVVILFFGLAPIAFAEGFVALAPIPGLTKDIAANTEGLAIFFNNLYRFAIGMAAVLAVIMIIWGGLEYSTQDSISKKSDGKQRIYDAILGLVLVLSPVLVFSIINPKILNLSINLERLDTRSGAPVGTGGGGGAQTQITNTATGCTVTGTSGILQVAVCPSVEAAQGWGEECSLPSRKLSDINTTNLDSVNPSTGIRETRSINIVTCAGTQPYTFIDKPSATTWAVNRLQPLVRTVARPNNGSDAMSFVNACRGANLSDFGTCISDIPLFTYETDCELSPQREWKCYTETLSCEYSSNGSKCNDSPPWTPFQ